MSLDRSRTSSFEGEEALVLLEIIFASYYFPDDSLVCGMRRTVVVRMEGPADALMAG